MRHFNPAVNPGHFDIFMKAAAGLFGPDAIPVRAVPGRSFLIHVPVSPLRASGNARAAPVLEELGRRDLAARIAGDLAANGIQPDAMAFPAFCEGSLVSVLSLFGADEGMKVWRDVRAGLFRLPPSFSCSLVLSADFGADSLLCRASLRAESMLFSEGEERERRLLSFAGWLAERKVLLRNRLKILELDSREAELPLPVTMRNRVIEFFRGSGEGLLPEAAPSIDMRPHVLRWQSSVCRSLLSSACGNAGLDARWRGRERESGIFLYSRAIDGGRARGILMPDRHPPADDDLPACLDFSVTKSGVALDSFVPDMTESGARERIMKVSGKTRAPSSLLHIFMEMNRRLFSRKVSRDQARRAFLDAGIGAERMIADDMAGCFALESAKAGAILKFAGLVGGLSGLARGWEFLD